MYKTIMMVIFLLLLMAGCTTSMNGPTQEVSVTSNPPGAIITPTDYKCWIRTPGVIKLERSHSTVLTARLDGYKEAKQEIKCQLSPWFFGNAVGEFYPWSFLGFDSGGLALAVFDLTTGSMGDLNPKEVHFELVPNSSGSVVSLNQ